MLIKILILALMLVILICLGSGVVYLIRDTSQDKRLLKALTWRIGLSFGLFLLLLLAFALGLIQPGYMVR